MSSQEEKPSAEIRSQTSSLGQVYEQMECRATERSPAPPQIVVSRTLASSESSGGHVLWWCRIAFVAAQGFFEHACTCGTARSSSRGTTFACKSCPTRLADLATPEGRLAHHGMGEVGLVYASLTMLDQFSITPRMTILIREAAFRNISESAYIRVRTQKWL